MFLCKSNAAFRGAALALGGVAAALTFFGGAANALTDKNFTYSSVRTGFYAIHPMDMAPDGNVSAKDPEYFVDYDNDTLSSQQGCYNAGVNLPQGARLVALSVYYRGKKDSDLDIILHRLTLATGTVLNLVNRSIADGSNVRHSTTFPIDPEVSVVGNGAYAYGFAVCLHTGIVFGGARITYTYTSAGD